MFNETEVKTGHLARLRVVTSPYIFAMEAVRARGQPSAAACDERDLANTSSELLPSHAALANLQFAIAPLPPPPSAAPLVLAPVLSPAGTQLIEFANILFARLHPAAHADLRFDILQHEVQENFPLPSVEAAHSLLLQPQHDVPELIQWLTTAVAARRDDGESQRRHPSTRALVRTVIVLGPNGSA